MGVSMSLKEAVELLAEHISRTTGKNAKVRKAMEIIILEYLKKSEDS